MFMVLGLITDVLAHRFDMHRTYAELAVPVLPGKMGIPWIEGFDPNGRCGFNLFYNLGGNMIFGLGKKDMDVVAHGIDFDERRIVVLRTPVM